MTTKRAFRRNLSRRLIDGMAAAGINRGVGPSQRYLLTVVGRKTHSPHTTPVSVVVEGSDRYLVGPYGEVGWVRNVRESGEVTLARAGRSERFSASPISETEAGPILRRYLKLEPITRPYFTASVDASAKAFEVEAATHPVFRLTPAVSAPATEAV
ncbi:MAG: nitroreductase/quinone reductase family protein [Candidatus Dormibacterales bacterium]